MCQSGLDGRPSEFVRERSSSPLPPSKLQLFPQSRQAAGTWGHAGRERFSASPQIWTETTSRRDEEVVLMTRIGVRVAQSVCFFCESVRAKEHLPFFFNKKFRWEPWKLDRLINPCRVLSGDRHISYRSAAYDRFATSAFSAKMIGS
ncbi:hypothetical protein N7510_007372 [Penicillium lagena]|uniref:uncharacterized protein n=1 Tax=Penicillium lagena TaxID=94218 RepID=UPI00254051D1|nr:uncharacterized protein N7510_007372 [Penicillium lagena]KAJ5610653.1 hypothetical protein N7510_007372 [Penicillium lagena]